MTDRYAPLQQAGLVAVVRAEQPELVVRLAAALMAGGIRAIELTFTIPGAAEALTEVRRIHGDAVLLGAGTIREPSQIEVAVRAGADFLVTPHLRPDLLAAMLATGLPAIPGVLTPSEVAAALDAGAEVVKLFPASAMGPGYLRSLRGPFPNLRAVPTGGIDAPDLADWFGAGALAVGVGSELAPRALLAEGRWAELTARASRFIEAARVARAGLLGAR